MPATQKQRGQKVRAVKTVRNRARSLRDKSAGQAIIPRVSAKRAHERSEKSKWTLGERRQWWRRYPTVDIPMLPLPNAKIPEKDLLQAKVQAIEAMQEFGVLVEASRASGMGRSQICYWVRKESTDPDFQLAMRQARKECQERLEGAFIQRGMEKGGDLAGIFYLKHNREKYREIQRVELTGKDGSPLNALDAAKADLLARLGKLAGPRGREGLEGKRELVLEAGGSAGSSAPEVKRARARREA